MRTTQEHPALSQAAEPRRLLRLHPGLTAPSSGELPATSGCWRLTGAAEAQKTLLAFSKDVFSREDVTAEPGPAEGKHRSGWVALEVTEKPRYRFESQTATQGFMALAKSCKLSKPDFSSALSALRRS